MSASRDPTALASLIVQHLDLGTLVCTKRPVRVLFANPAAAAALADLTGRSTLPAELARLIASCGDRFGTAQPVIWPRTGLKYYVRAKTFSDEPNLAVVTLAPARARAASRGELLRTRYGLSHRQCLFVELVCEGLTNLQIAEQLGLTVGTVKQYLHIIFTAIDVRSRADLIRLLADAQ